MRFDLGILVDRRADIDHVGLLREFLCTATAESDERWRTWSTWLMRLGGLTAPFLLAWWREIIGFDEVLAQHVAEPIAVPERTVLVAGSGKEVFKTFNVSTAAAILAATAGVRVVKGVSRSVSAVSGAADILDVLGIRTAVTPSAIPAALGRHGVAFIEYPAFCPRYARRYDGVFVAINPASFFMPIAALCVRAESCVFGLAHQDVGLSAQVITLIRPDLIRGTVTVTDLVNGELVDEACPYGVMATATIGNSMEPVTVQRREAPNSRWREVVAHRDTHAGNARMLMSALTDHGISPHTELVEYNAALIYVAANSATPWDDALACVRDARRSGRAARLLIDLIGER